MALLDALNIRRAVVIGMSNGGPSALQFALRHPDRCSGLVMIEAISHRAPPPSRIAGLAFSVIFQSDFVFWLITKYFKTNMIALLGVPPEVQAKQAPKEKKWLSKLLQTMHPISLRRAGMFNDGSFTTSTSLNSYPLERIRVPTLVIHTVDDSLIPLTHGQNTARRVPGARMITLQSGGHLLMGRHEEVRSALTEFLKQHGIEQ
jgi:pimeloyl-ACP methyl ester carboxylesterase